MQKFSKKEAFKFGWETFKKNPGFLIGVVLVTFIISYIPGILYSGATEGGQNPNWLLYVLIMLPATIIQLIVGMGVMKIAIDFAEGKKPEFSDLYSQYPKTINYFVASLLYGLMVGLGFILLIVPGIYLGIKYQFYTYLIVDKNLGPLAALKKSGEITEGSKWNLFLFGLLSALVVVAGMLALFVGLLVATPVVMVAGAYVYKKLKEAGK